MTKTKPQVVIACYGMNDGIYYPFSEDRFQKYQEGIRRLRERAIQSGARVILVTPPVFDSVPIKDRTLPAGRDAYPQPYAGYNDVLDRYADWLLTQRAQGWEVVDFHGPINRFLAERRQRDPAFSLAGDGVHPNAMGHWLMARPLLEYFGAPAEWCAPDNPQPMLAQRPGGVELLKWIQQRQRLLKDVWLSDTGHKRPGMNRGLPLADAQKQAADITAKIRALDLDLPAPEIRRDAAGNVTLTCAAQHVTLRYTLDGADPAREAGAYLAPIRLPWEGTVKARAFLSGDGTNGALATVTFPALEMGANAPARPHSALLPVTQNRDWRSYDWPIRHAAIQALVRARPPKLVFIGDSITHFFGGEPNDHPANGGGVWQKFYARRNAVNLGYGWDRTENVLWRLQHGELEGASPAVVVVLIGTNNLERNSPDEIADGIRAICGELHTRLPQVRILLLGILPRSPKPDGLRPKIAEVNQRIARLEGQNGVTYLDIGAKFLAPDGSIPAALMSDYLHPTAEGCTVFCEAIEPTLARLLGETK